MGGTTGTTKHSWSIYCPEDEIPRSGTIAICHLRAESVVLQTFVKYVFFAGPRLGHSQTKTMINTRQVNSSIHILQYINWWSSSACHRYKVAFSCVARYREGVAWDSARTELGFHQLLWERGADDGGSCSMRRLQDVLESDPGLDNPGRLGPWHITNPSMFFSSGRMELGLGLTMLDWITGNGIRGMMVPYHHYSGKSHIIQVCHSITSHTNIMAVPDQNYTKKYLLK